MDDFNHQLLASTMPYQIKAIATLAQVESRPCGYVQDVREVDPENGNKLNVQSTTNHTCKVRALGTPEIHPKLNLCLKGSRGARLLAGKHRQGDSG